MHEEILFSCVAWNGKKKRRSNGVQWLNLTVDEPTDRGSGRSTGGKERPKKKIGDSQVPTVPVRSLPSSGGRRGPPATPSRRRAARPRQDFGDRGRGGAFPRPCSHTGGPATPGPRASVARRRLRRPRRGSTGDQVTRSPFPLPIELNSAHLPQS